MGFLHLSDLCGLFSQNGLSARLDGMDRPIRSVNTLESATEGELSFLSNPKYLAAVGTTSASAIIVQPGVQVPERLSTIRCSDPYAAVTIAIIALHGHRKHPQWGISDQAVIHPTAKLGKNANIAHGVTIASDVVIGDDCTLYPGCYVAEGVRVGHDCIFYPNVVIYDHSELGDRVTIHAGSVIGEDGLGYAPKEGTWIKIPQVGRAVLGNDVEIGANCCIDRATLGHTFIGEGSKFGNAVVIGHGTKIGPHCMFVGLVGVAGSVTVGRHVTMGGQVGIAGHLSIGDDVSIGAQSGIMSDVEPNTKLFGTPSMPVADAMRSIALFQRLPELAKKLRMLEGIVNRLQEQLKGSGKKLDTLTDEPVARSTPKHLSGV